MASFTLSTADVRLSIVIGNSPGRFRIAQERHMRSLPAYLRGGRI